jgi:hypothetical protein
MLQIYKNNKPLRNQCEGVKICRAFLVCRKDRIRTYNVEQIEGCLDFKSKDF